MYTALKIMEKETSLFKFDKMWCLTACNENRIRNITNEFKRLGLNVDFYYNPQNPIVTGFDKKPFYKDIECKFSFTKDINIYKTTNGICSCFMGHYNIIKTSYELGYNNILIFEDDFKLKDNIVFDNILQQVPNDFDIISFYIFGKSKAYNNELDFFKKVTTKQKVRSTILYGLSRRYMKQYLQLYSNLPIPADYFYDDIDTNIYNFYVARYNIIDNTIAKNSTIVV